MSESFPNMNQLNQTPKPNPIELELVPLEDTSAKKSVEHRGGSYELNAQAVAQKQEIERQMGIAPKFNIDKSGRTIVDQKEADRIAELTKGTRVDKLELVPEEEQGKTIH